MSLNRPIIAGLLIGVIFVILAALDSIGYMNAPQGVVAQLLGPVSGTLRRAGVYLGVRTAYSPEYKALRDERDWLLTELTRMAEVDEENRALRTQLHIPAKERAAEIYARILGADPTGIGRVVVLDKGKNQGVKPGDLVAAPGHMVVGKVVETAGSTSRVMLIHDPGSSLAVRFQKSGASGVLKGDFGLTLIVDLIPKDVMIEPGDIIVTAGIEGVKSGLVVGRVAETIKKEAALFYTVRITPAADLSRLAHVFVISSTPLQ